MHALPNTPHHAQEESRARTASVLQKSHLRPNYKRFHERLILLTNKYVKGHCDNHETPWLPTSSVSDQLRNSLTSILEDAAKPRTVHQRTSEQGAKQLRRDGGQHKKATRHGASETVATHDEKKPGDTRKTGTNQQETGRAHTCGTASAASSTRTRKRNHGTSAARCYPGHNLQPSPWQWLRRDLREEVRG